MDIILYAFVSAITLVLPLFPTEDLSPFVLDVDNLGCFSVDGETPFWLLSPLLIISDEYFDAIFCCFVVGVLMIEKGYRCDKVAQNV